MFVWISHMYDTYISETQLMSPPLARSRSLAVKDQRISRGEHREPQASLAKLGASVFPELRPLIWIFQRNDGRLFAQSKGTDRAGGRRKRSQMDKKTSDVLQGTLDLMILKTLHALGPLHGFGIARRIEQVSRDVLQLNEGTVYTSLLRLQQQGWITAEWGTSENNRKAKFYSITARGRKQLEIETENWERISSVIRRVLRQEAEG
jgi:PadR family transcriptional regulator PadR